MGLSIIVSWTAPLWISRFGASHGFYKETVASAKTANKFGSAANIEAFDAKWRCPVSVCPQTNLHRENTEKIRKKT